MVILNAGKIDPIGPIPILFIPSSSDKLIKHANFNILICYLNALVKYLEIIFIKGFLVLYAYPAEAICDKLPLIPTNELITLRAMVTIWTRDHLAQCKIGGFKMDGYSCCRRHKVASRWRGIPNANNSLVKYYDNKNNTNIKIWKILQRYWLIDVNCQMEDIKIRQAVRLEFLVILFYGDYMIFKVLIS